MQVILGKDGLGNTWQKRFEETEKCVHCGEISRIGFVAYEHPEAEPDGPWICDMHRNERDSKWLHDCCCVAVYFCTKCLETTSKYNQG